MDYSQNANVFKKYVLLNATEKVLKICLLCLMDVNR